MLSSVLTILAAIALLIFVSVRQLSWQPVKARRLLMTPLVLVGAAVVVGIQTYPAMGAPQVGIADVLTIAAELGLAVVGGLLMGRLTRIDIVAGEIKSRLTGPGLAIWFGFIAVRITMAVLSHQAGGQLASSTPLIFVLIAIVKGIQAFVITRRVDRLASAPARVPVDSLR
ncbi:hypothetical protein [Microlunatus speluncae]|uniref:hypothetical protein n=1 Tax=Microlunatus speluncae TaxID=2594267 RepID=UPI00126665FA|nr:hypothetical protein [Microlunatus speluncae]